MAFAYESITVADSAIGLTTATYAVAGAETAISALCTLETAQIRFRVDGEDPTSTEGHIWNVGTTLVFSRDELAKLKMIRTGGTSGVVKCSYAR